MKELRYQTIDKPSRLLRDKESPETQLDGGENLTTFLNRVKAHLQPETFLNLSNNMLTVACFEDLGDFFNANREIRIKGVDLSFNRIFMSDEKNTRRVEVGFQRITQSVRFIVLTGNYVPAKQTVVETGVYDWLLDNAILVPAEILLGDAHSEGERKKRLERLLETAQAYELLRDT